LPIQTAAGIDPNMYASAKTITVSGTFILKKDIITINNNKENNYRII
jgi:hypothetical protein